MRRSTEVSEGGPEPGLIAVSSPPSTAMACTLAGPRGRV